MANEKFMALENTIQTRYGNTAGITVVKNGDFVYEKYFGDCDAENFIHVFSVTKSVISALIGIALDKGYIKSLDQKVLEFFPDYQVKEKEKTIQEITLRNLLTMTAPYKEKLNPYPEYFTSPDWVEFSLDMLGGSGKIGDFQYAPLIGPDILSGILERVSGQTVLDFAREQLFAPMDISVAEAIVFRSQEEQMAFYDSTTTSGWVAGPTGVNTAGWGLTLTTKDMAKIGQLYAAGGVWNEQQLVPKRWIEESTQEHSCWKEMNLQYGYLWWVLGDGSFAALGDGGNTIYVNPQKQLTVAISALFVPEAEDRIDLIKTEIEPLFE
ncbi:serine hydrolase domain-containing protein [Candidatus Enterococcus ferrettii]|uniref:Beta-lactamase-related domain-containing protein n=1 Tax=Candidatus Enterococcus ferrettii TaxID=2815324 RepID=A0ABV0EV27_9ENTE|nr:serine hydrolase [Enterococcus sp. 665A]MBO1342364.1 serine hydrolase [Enterococcus sp. 665A]